MPKICCISDTHNKHRSIVMPEADILICTGDISMKGELSSIGDFSNWLAGLDYKYKLYCHGNHELGADRPGKKRDDGIKLIKDAGAIYLEHDSVVIDGIKIWLSPATPFFYNWSFNYQRGKDIASIWARIPDDVQIVGTHGMPANIMDNVSAGWGPDDRVGCEDLAKRIAQLKDLKLYVGGHLHRGAGTQIINGITYVNAAICDDSYQPTHQPIVIDI